MDNTLSTRRLAEVSFVSRTSAQLNEDDSDQLLEFVKEMNERCIGNNPAFLYMH